MRRTQRRPSRCQSGTGTSRCKSRRRTTRPKSKEAASDGPVMKRTRIAVNPVAHPTLADRPSSGPVPNPWTRRNLAARLPSRLSNSKTKIKVTSTLRIKTIHNSMIYWAGSPIATVAPTSSAPIPKTATPQPVERASPPRTM